MKTLRPATMDVGMTAMRSVGRFNFDKGMHNLITLILKLHQITILLYYIMELTVESHEHYQQDIMSIIKKVHMNK